MFNKNSNILITGGTGSFGQKFVEEIIRKKIKFNKMIIFSRDEMKQWNMSNKYKSNKKLRFFIGDVRDKERLDRAMKDVDYVIHAAATKIVPTAEYDPFECIKTNIFGAMNVIDTAIDNNVKKIVALSTDKASDPVNLYGATKLVSDRLFAASTNYINSNQSTKFSIVRYGNVMGSRGSVIPFFLDQQHKNYFTVTDKEMTRFMIKLEDAVKLVLFAFNDMIGGETYVKKIPSMKVLDIARTINSKCKIKFTGVRPGEKIHEQMIGKEDALNTFEYKDFFKIIPTTLNKSKKPYIKNGKKVAKNFIYNSNSNTKWMSDSELKKWIKQNHSKLLKI